ncbi:DUF4214 domain-containing protein, partial [Ramlibacter sp. WS9]|uniref:DUF4214 domain-containing protein n=1 Tax=Ramlibacter sp. WS9 TaxID=1882741 RepID=UPI0011430085
MVAIVSGNSLGLSLTSLATLGQRGVFGSATQGQSNERAFVNIATGNLVLQSLDDHVESLGPDIDALRTYNSQGLLDDDNGDNWTSGAFKYGSVQYTGTLNASGSTVTRTGQDGAKATYVWNSTQARYTSTAGAGAYDYFTYSSTSPASFTWTDGDTRTQETYKKLGTKDGKDVWNLTSVSDVIGNATSYTYDANFNLQTVVSDSGETFSFAYSSGRLTSINITPSGSTKTTRVVYAYESTAPNRLTSVTVDLSPQDSLTSDGKTFKTTYTYDGTSARVASVTQSDGTKLSFTYVLSGGTYRVATVKDGLNQQTSYTYGAGTTTVTDPLGRATVYAYDAEGQLTSVTEPAVAGVLQITSFEYVNGDLTEITDPMGRVTTMGYANGNQIWQRDAAGNTITRTFDAKNQLLTETLYATPDPEGGTLAPTAPQVTRYVYDTDYRALLRFVISPEGRVTRYVNNATTGLRDSVLRYDESVYPVTALAITDVPTVSDLTTWTTGKNAQISRTDMAYDFRGQPKTQTEWATVDTNGYGVADGKQSVTTFVYDYTGRLQSTVSPTAGSTVYTYDGMGRVLTVSNALSEVTTNTYNDAGNTLSVKLANNLITTSNFDAAGRLLSVVQGALSATTTFKYDAANRLVMTQDPTGVRAWMLYDEAGRQVAHVDGDGTLTEYVYDRNDRLTHTIAYATAVNVALLGGTGEPLNPSLASIRPAANAKDQHAWRAYDAAGRLARTIDANGAVTQTVYDGASRIVSTVQYATALSTAGLGDTPAADSFIAPHADDRVSRHFYDADGLLVGTLDAEGYLSEMQYDAAGALVRSTSYAVATDPTKRATGTLAALKPALTPAADAVTTYLRDAKGQIVGVVDAEGYLTENTYDLSGNLTQAVRYVNKVTASYTVRSSPVGLRPYDPMGQDQTHVRVYDKLNRVSQETDFQGTVTQYTYDNTGNLTKTVRAVGTSEVRTLNARYDAQGRLVGELSAEGALQLYAGQTAAQIDLVWAQWGLTHAYDLAGRRASTTDQNGNRTLFFYNVDGQLTHTVNALGEVAENEYDALGQLKATVRYANRLSLASLTALAGDKAGGLVNSTLTSAIAAATAANPAALDSRADYTYSVTGALASSTDALGFKTSYLYNLFGQETSRAQTLGSGAIYEQTAAYDRRGLVLTRVDDALGANIATAVVYDAFGRARSTTTAGDTRSAEYDRLGRQIRAVDAMGFDNKTSYDGVDRVTTQTDALGNITTYTYNKTVRTVVVKTPENITVTTGYSRLGQTLDVTDGRGNVTAYQYDKNGNLKKTVEADSTFNSSSYDRAGRLIQTIDGNGKKVDLTYDAANRVLTRTVDGVAGGLNLSTQYKWDAQGQQIEVTDANGTVTQFTYDLNGHLKTQKVDPGTVGVSLNLLTAYEYDERANVLTVTSPSGLVTSYTYDTLGRRTNEVADPDPTAAADPTRLISRSWTYDESGNAVTCTDAKGGVTRYVYDANDRMTRQIDATGAVTAFEYDKSGNLTDRIGYATRLTAQQLADAALPGATPATPAADPARDAHARMVYDKNGRMVASATAQGTDAAGNLKWTITRQVYDNADNVVSRTTYASTLSSQTLAAQPTQDQVAAWVNTAAVNALVDRTERMAYDQLNRLVYNIDPVNTVTKWIYDANSNVVQQRVYATPLVIAGTPAAAAIASALQASTDDRISRTVYDAANRVAFTLNAAGGLTKTEYDAQGNITTRRYANAFTTSLDVLPLATVLSTLVADNTNDRIEQRLFDRAGRLTSVIAGGNTTQSVYDERGNLWKLIEPGGRVSEFFYDAAGRITRSVDAMGAAESYTYDPLGNKVSFTNKLNKTWTYEYDASGRLTKETAPEVEVTTVTFDADNRVATGTPSMAAMVTQIAYDAFGNVESRTEAAGRPEARTTSYRYDAAGRQVKTIFPPVDVHLEGTKTLEVNVTYDALGNAIANQDVAGRYSYKVYDKAGQVVWDVDAGGQVTGYTRNAFGDVSELKRYSMAIGTAGITFTANVNDAFVKGLLPATDAAARTLTTQYDTLGRAIKVIEPQAYAFDPNIVGGEHFTAARTTATTYNALGDALRISVYGQNSSGTPVTTTTDTYFKYDILGRRTEEVAVYERAMGAGTAKAYLTTMAYDAVGNLTEQVEYAGNVTVTDSLWSAKTGVSRSAVAASGDDRKIRYEYYLNNLKKSETRVNVLYTPAGAATALRGDQVTSFEYDVLGNATRTVDALGTSTYTAYDVLGRVTWVQTGPALTEFKHDVYGNVVQRTELGVLGDAADDRVSFTVYDTSGHAIRNVDALSNSSYSFYDRYGHVARQAQDVWTKVNGTPTVQTAFTEFSYDALGQVIETRDAMGGSQQIDYNAFGEVTHKGVNGAARHEHYDYDNAGHLWRTNAGDGVYKVALYDIAGHQTADIRSAVKPLGAYSNAASVVILGDLVRTDTRYNLLGHVVGQIRPMQYAGEVGSVEGSTVNAVRIVSLEPLKIYATLSAAAEKKVTYGESEGAGNTNTWWEGRNSVDLTWDSLAGLGSGDVQVTLTYRTEARASTQYVTQVFSADAALTGAKISWDNTQPPGIIDRIEVKKKGADGNWKTLIDRTQTGDYGNQIRIHTPPDPATQVWLKYSKNGVLLDTVAFDERHRFGDAIVFDASGLAEGDYTYEVLKREPGEAQWSAWDQGTMTVVSPAARRRIAELFVAVRNRAPDAVGLAKYLNMYQAGTSLATIAQEMLTTLDDDLAASPYAGLENAPFITKFYTMVLGRPAESIPQEDLDFWVGQLQINPNRGAMLVTMIAATTGYTSLDMYGQGTINQVALDSQRLFNNKVDAGLKYAIDYVGYDIGVARSIMTLVTAGSDTVSLSDAKTTLYRTQVIELYALLFNRAPDAAGLNYWAGLLADPTWDRQEVAQVMLDTGVGLGFYPANITNTALITSIYQNALGRSVDTASLNYWLEQFAGHTRGRVFTDMVDMVTDYDGVDFTGLTSQQLFKNKVAVSQAYMALDHSTLSLNEQIAASKAIFNGITSAAFTAESMNAAVAAAQATYSTALAAANAATPLVAPAIASADAVMRGQPGAAAVNTQIAQLYVLLFNRAPDYDGLMHWATKVAQEGLDFAELAQAIYNSGQTLGKIFSPDVGHDLEIISGFYTQALKRTPPDAEGLAYWRAQLVQAQQSSDANARGAVVASFIGSVMEYGGTVTDAINAKKVFNNKVAVALAYSTLGGNDQYLTGTTASYTVLSQVTADSIAAATAQVQLYIDAATVAAKAAIAAPATSAASNAATTGAAAAVLVGTASLSARDAVPYADIAHATPTADYRLEVARLYAALYPASPAPTLALFNSWADIRVGASAASVASQMLNTTAVKNNGYPTTLSATQFVTRLYQLGLGREPDATGLNYWVGVLNSNGNNRGAVAADLLSTTANNTGTSELELTSRKNLAAKAYNILGPLAVPADSAVAPALATLQAATTTKTATDSAFNSPYKTYVCQLFKGIFGRAPANVTEVNSWTARFSSPSSMQAVVTYALSTSEAIGYYGAYVTTTDYTSNAAWVEKIYQRCLGRAADSGGLQSWTDKLGAGGMSRAQAATEIIYTAANYNGTDPLGIQSHNDFVNIVNGYLGTINTAKTAADSAYTAANNAYTAAVTADNATTAASNAAYMAMVALTDAVATVAPLAAAALAAATMNATPTAAFRLEVAQLFTALYSRAPSLAELNTWSDLRASKTAVEVVTSMLAASSLYSSIGNNTDFAKQLYKTVVNVTSPAAADVTFWTNKANAVGRAQAAIEFNYTVVNYTGNDTTGVANQKYHVNRVAAYLAPLVSQAASANTSAQATLPLAGAVKLGSAALSGTASSFTPASGSWGTYYLQADQLYLMLKGRVPTAAESTALATELAGGKTVIDAATTLLANNTLYPAGQSNSQFIDTLYRTALGRPADSEGLQFWGERLVSPYNWSRGKLVYELIANVYVYKGTSAAGLASQALFNNNTYAALYTVAGVANAYSLQVVAQADAAEAARDVAKDVWDALKVIVTTNIGSATALQQANDGTVGLFTQQYGVRPKIEQTVDRWGNVLAVTDPRNAAWSSYSTYNANNQLVGTTRSDNFQTITTENFYDQLGRLVATRDGRGYVNRNLYDERGNLVEEQHADGGIVHYDLNAFGERDTVHQASGSQIHYTYDKMGRVETTTRAYLQGVDAYDAIGVGDGASNISLTAGEHIQLTEKYTYDALGRRVKITDEATAKIAEQIYDLRGNLIESIDGYGRSTEYSWDMFGHKTAELAADNGLQGWTLDAWGNVEAHNRSEISADGTTTTITHTDFSYNKLWQISAQTSYRDTSRDQTFTHLDLQNLAYTYDNASGLLVKIEDKAATNVDASAAVQVTQYAYDAAGNRTREKTSAQKTVSGQVSELDVSQDNHNTYDRLGRLIGVRDSRYDVTFRYDQNGNRTEVHTHYLSETNAKGVAATAANATTDNTIRVYNAYDQMNRQTVVDGVLVNGVADIGQDLEGKWVGQKITYDLSGNQTSMQQRGTKLVFRENPGYYQYWDKEEGIVTETYNYDAAGRLTDVLRDGVNIDARRYDKAGRLVQSGGAAIPNEEGLAAALEGAGVAVDRHYSDYDDKGQLLHQSTRARAHEKNTDAWFRGYDAVGRLLEYKTTVDGQANFYTYTYENWDHNKVHDIYVWRPSDGKHSRTTNGYDANGNLVQVKTEKDNWKFDVRDFVNDASGRILRKTESGYGTNINNEYKPDVHVTTTLIANGEVVGSSSDDAAAVKNTFRSSYVPVTDSGYSASPTAYTVQGTETLQMIARAVWGNADLWYVIADANGIDTVHDGDVIMIPAKPNTIYNSTSTFTPYDPTRAIGDTTPTLPAPDAKKTNWLKMLIVAIIAVVVTIFTMGAATMYMASTLGTAFAGGVGAGVGAVMTTGMATLGTATFGLAAASAAVGSIVSQGVAVAIGAQDKFSWKGVALSALSAGVGAGVSEFIPTPLGGAASDFGNVVARAAIGNTITQGIGVATGLQDRFDWRGVAASAVGAGVGQAVGGAMGMNDQGFKDLSFGQQFGARLVTGLAAGTAAAVMRGGKVAIQQVATDAFGNALGSSLAEANWGVGQQAQAGLQPGQLGSGSYFVPGVDDA